MCYRASVSVSHEINVEADSWGGVIGGELTGEQV
jgi:hypothetical protein